MKKASFVALITASITLVGCGGVNPSQAAQSPQDAWDSIIASAQAENCDNFKKHTTERLDILESDCEKAFNSFAEGIPDIDWDTIIFNADRTEAKLSLTNGRTLTTFVKDSDGAWKADSKFWR